MATTSEIARRPAVRRTRNASRNTAALSGERLMTQLETTTSTLASATGRCSISPSRNSTFSAWTRAALERAFVTIAGVMSTPGYDRSVRPAWPRGSSRSRRRCRGRGRSRPGGGRDCLRIAAAEAEVGAFGHRREVVRRVAELQAGARIGPAATGNGAPFGGLCVGVANSRTDAVVVLVGGHRCLRP